MSSCASRQSVDSKKIASDESNIINRQIAQNEPDSPYSKEVVCRIVQAKNQKNPIIEFDESFNIPLSEVGINTNGLPMPGSSYQGTEGDSIYKTKNHAFQIHIWANMRKNYLDQKIMNKNIFYKIQSSNGTEKNGSLAIESNFTEKLINSENNTTQTLSCVFN